MKTLQTFFMLVLFMVQHAVAQVNNTASQPDYAIAYTSTEGDNRDIYLTDVAGSAKMKVTDFAGGNGYSAWSPDGKRLAFYAKYDEKKTWSIHTINVDGTSRKRLTDEVNHWDNSPAWSPDGSQIAFAKVFRDSQEAWQYQIWIMNADGTDQRQIEGLEGGGPYFSPTGEIVYHSQPGPSEIYIANADGNNPRQLTHNEAEDWHPEVSPDGTRIAFMSNRDGNNEIYVMNRDGSDQKRLTFSEDEKDWYPSWSPDGAELLVSSSKDEGEERRVYRMKADGSDKRTVVKNGAQAAWLKLADKKAIDFPLPQEHYTIAYGSNGISLTNVGGTSQVKLTEGDHGYPAWSPDGKQLAFYGYYDNKKTWSIHTVDRDGMNLKRLTHVKFKWDNMPCWSYDGTQIVFAREYDAGGVQQYELWVMNADGSGERQLKALSGGGPRFLPDGRLLFHSEHLDKESEISIATLDGHSIVHLTDNEAEEWDPKLSPDGQQIVFTSNRDGNHEVYVMNIDGSDQRRLTNNEIDDYGPVWSLDGTQIVFQSKGEGAKEDDPTGLYIMNKDGSSKRRIVEEGWQPAWFRERR